jgi:hypothetical protein
MNCDNVSRKAFDSSKHTKSYLRRHGIIPKYGLRSGTFDEDQEFVKRVSDLRGHDELKEGHLEYELLSILDMRASRTTGPLNSNPLSKFELFDTVITRPEYLHPGTSTETEALKMAIKWLIEKGLIVVVPDPQTKDNEIVRITRMGHVIIERRVGI